MQRIFLKKYAAVSFEEITVIKGEKKHVPQVFFFSIRNIVLSKDCITIIYIFKIIITLFKVIAICLVF